MTEKSVDVFSYVERVYSRLFRQHPVLVNELLFLVNELEGKRKDREKIRMNEIQTQLDQIHEELHPKAVEGMIHSLPSLEEKINRALSLCKKSCEVDTSKAMTLLSEGRAKRQSQWELVQNEMSRKHEELKRNQETALNELENHYRELEKNLLTKSWTSRPATGAEQIAQPETTDEN